LEDYVTSGPDSAAAKCLDTTQDLLLFQHVEEPTRVRLGQRPSILDYVFTDDKNVVDESMYKDPLGKSDHVLLEWNLLIETVHAKNTQRKLNFCKGDYELIAEELLKINWKPMFQNQNVKQLWSILKSIIESLSEEHIPLKLDYKKKKGHWLSKPTIKLMKQRSIAWKNIKISNPQPTMRIIAK